MIDRAALAARIRDAHGGALPSLIGGAGCAPTTITAGALTAENVTLTVVITSARFEAAARRWDPARSGTAVTVTVTSTDTRTGARRHIALDEPEAWARAVFAEFDDDMQRIYMLGAVDPDTGRSEFGLMSYRLYIDDNDDGSAPMRVPPQIVTMPHYWIGPQR